NVEYLLTFWLGEIPPYLVSFLQWTLAFSLIETLSNPLISMAQATGKIKRYQIIIGSFITLTLPCIWVVFKITNNTINVYSVLIINSSLAYIIRILFLKKMVGLNLKMFFVSTLSKILIVAGLNFLLLIVFK